MVVGECILGIANGKPVFICVVDDGDVGVDPIILMFHHNPRVQVVYFIICTDTEYSIFYGDARGGHNGIVTTECDVP